jgi:VWFA-related protein
LNVLAGSLALVMVGVQAQPQVVPRPASQQTVAQQTVAQQAIPDAPRPQATLPNVNSVTPGQGTSSSSNTDLQPSEGPSAATPAVPAAPAPSPAGAPTGQSSNVDIPSGQGEDAIKTLYVNVNAVDIAFTVKDSKGHLVPGLTARQVNVYENGVLQHKDLFTNEALPMSVALVIDQSMTHDEMERVNDSLGALQDAFTKYDEVAVFTYNKSPKMMTEFTGAQSARLTQAIDRSKGSGTDALMAGSLSGPMAQTTTINDMQFDPNTAPVRGNNSMQLNAPRDVHALNDAILAAATSLSNRPLGRRRVIYVISDGKEYGSQAKTSQVVKYLQTNNIELDATLVGDSAVWGMGFLDRVHLPLMMRDNVLPAYAYTTGGNIDSEFRTNSIEKSFARVALEARTRYTIGYRTSEPWVDGKYRKIEINVLLPDLTVIAPPGYWPGGRELRPTGAHATTP